MGQKLTIDVAMTSWPNHPRRIEYLTQILESLKEKLSASEHDLKFYCSAETEPDPKATWHGDELEAICQQYGIDLQWRDAKANLGANMNAAMRMGTGEFILLNQDDWWLRAPLDLSLGANLLHGHPELDIVRYCWPQADYMALTLKEGPEGWRLIDPKGRWPYGDDPHLRRRDFMGKWGWYFEGGGHGSASGTLMKLLASSNSQSVVADKVYYEHKGRVSAVLGDVRSGKNRRYEE
jgi:hypothetical protein